MASDLAIALALSVAPAVAQPAPLRTDGAPAVPPPAMIAPRGPNLPPEPRTNPANWINSGDYPTSALRQAIEGTVFFLLDVNADGRVESCRVTRSSGVHSLDTTTCRTMQRRARFFPATNARGKEVAGRYSNRVMWVLPDDQTRTTILGWPAPKTFLTSDGYPRPPRIVDMAWNSIRPDDYPKASRDNLEQGATLLTLDIAASGQVARCTVRETSGYPMLDAKSCDLARTRLVLDPALDALGKPTAGRLYTGVDWRLLDAQPPYPNTLATPPSPQPYDRAGEVTLTYHAKADGQISDCVQPQGPTSGFGNLVRLCEALQRAPTIRFKPFMDAAGQAVSRIVKVRFSVELEEEDAQ